jgi:hypothetical protein
MLQSKDGSVWYEAAMSLISLAKHGSFFMRHQCPVHAEYPVGEFEQAILDTEAVSVIACMLKDVSSDAQTSAAFFFSQMADHGWSIH